MTTIVEATFDGTVFRPSQPVDLEPNTPVKLIVETTTPQDAKPRSFLETGLSLKIEGPPDWSANVDKYLYGDDPDSSK